MLEKISTLSDSALDLLLENATKEKENRKLASKNIVIFESEGWDYQFNLKDGKLSIIHSCGGLFFSSFNHTVKELLKTSLGHPESHLKAFRSASALFTNLADALNKKLEESRVD